MLVQFYKKRILFMEMAGKALGRKRQLPEKVLLCN